MFKDISCGLDKSEFSAAITSIFSVTCCLKAFFLIVLTPNFWMVVYHGFPKVLAGKQISTTLIRNDS